MSLTVGQTAPDFTLIDTERKPRSLKEFAGKKVVLAFYPGAFTGACTKEMCALRDAMAAFNSLEAQVVGISVDSPFANKGFADANKVTFPLLSDFTREVRRSTPACTTASAALPVTLRPSERSTFLTEKGS